VSIAPDDRDVTIGPTIVGATHVGSTGDGRRFAPGSIIAGRYRLVALLGKGGMGEVYRAEDLTLDQQVALKFLPARGDRDDPAALAQFHNELRVARQVSHKNVCRLYDLGEFEGRRFLTMEYVDGEDLASLVRRIGRIPQDKGADIARQICAGLAAAHDRGVVHRDLKPANVMLDGDGNVRITDFGLATAADDASAELAGTPQYMAPEQLEGAAASIKSDIYALGLVLFELFTGKRALDAKSIRELRDLHSSGHVASPSSIVRDLDPAIERVILRCLDRDPARRPPSALSVSAALPGGDPLAEALAAGETPSPDLLVAAGEEDALPVWQGLAAVVSIVAALAVLVPLLVKGSLVRFQPLDKPPDVLIDRAEQILASIGYTEPRADRAFAFGPNLAYLQWIANVDHSTTRWSVLAQPRPTPLEFWYRTSPRLMMSQQLPFTVTLNDPPPREADAHRVELDTHGRLIELRSQPIQYDTSPASAGAPPWPLLFEAAGLTMANFAPATPSWSPADYADARDAWEGPLDGRPEIKVRVEGAAYHNRPVYFVVLGPWNVPTRQTQASASTLLTVMAIVTRVSIVAFMITALVLARRNTRSGRADMRGATRLATALGIIYLAAALIGGHYVADANVGYTALVTALMIATWQSAVLWMVYLALEPYGRRFWPDMLLGWSRLLTGHVRDARVGREVLAGVACGIAFTAVHLVRGMAGPWFGYPALRPMMGAGLDVLPGAAAFSRGLLFALFFEIGSALLMTLVFVICRLIVRRQAAAVPLGMVVLFYWWSSYGTANPVWLETIVETAAIVVLTIATIRFGLLTATVTLFVSGLLDRAPMTLDVGHWSATASNSTIIFVVGLTLFGYYAARGGQPLFGAATSASDPARTP
jgi:serine/threonine-protein kinase